eukprot:CAMPEP_0206335060 /NCGR_PEP_ID=MMETSP0106_2-20121207/26116_1 /ASSEMBLY_ACC=CAM_ASM_000206 /TAXON_ID=81532 /ORGANISM="Acanthoeca-like sp., Strain 10tr" /LENGTH=88 /DNA_ID=CAMNT_0053767991 /DNA_START=443 /DNA_END=709 /DNA_ORIENTATION=-
MSLIECCKRCEEAGLFGEHEADVVSRHSSVGMIGSKLGEPNLQAFTKVLQCRGKIALLSERIGDVAQRCGSVGVINAKLSESDPQALL